MSAQYACPAHAQHLAGVGERRPLARQRFFERRQPARLVQGPVNFDPQAIFTQSSSLCYILDSPKDDQAR